MRKLVTLGVGLLFLAAAQPTKAIQYADFVFVIDSTSSMGGEIAAVKSGLQAFVDGLNTAEIDARFAVVLFGGAPELVQDFTSSGADTETTLGRISVNNAVTGFQNNHNVNPEAGLEAIRIVLGGADVNTLLRTHVGGSGGLTFRSDARKNIIFVTDEDSDRPYYSANQESGQSSTEPPGTLTTAWQTEVDKTADAVVESDAFINMLINAGDAPSKYQYGDPNQDDADDDFLNFSPTGTLANLITAGYGSSLEAQVLDAELIGRTFNIGDINTGDFIDNFFAAKIEEIIDNPIDPNGVPDGGATVALLGLAVVALGALRRRIHV